MEEKKIEKEVKILRTRKSSLDENLVSIYIAYFEFVEFGSSRAAALYQAIEETMDIDMKIILQLANKRRAKADSICYLSEE